MGQHFCEEPGCARIALEHPRHMTHWQFGWHWGTMPSASHTSSFSSAGFSKQTTHRPYMLLPRLVSSNSPEYPVSSSPLHTLPLAPSAVLHTKRDVNPRAVDSVTSCALEQGKRTEKQFFQRRRGCSIARASVHNLGLAQDRMATDNTHGLLLFVAQHHHCGYCNQSYLLRSGNGCVGKSSWTSSARRNFSPRSTGLYQCKISILSSSFNSKWKFAPDE